VEVVFVLAWEDAWNPLASTQYLSQAHSPLTIVLHCYVLAIDSPLLKKNNFATHLCFVMATQNGERQDQFIRISTRTNLSSGKKLAFSKFQTQEVVTLSAFERAISNVVDITTYLERLKFVVVEKIETSFVPLDESKDRRHARILVTLRRTPELTKFLAEHRPSK